MATETITRPIAHDSDSQTTEAENQRISLFAAVPRHDMLHACLHKKISRLFQYNTLRLFTKQEEAIRYARHAEAQGIFTMEIDLQDLEQVVGPLQGRESIKLDHEDAFYLSTFSTHNLTYCPLSLTGHS